MAERDAGAGGTEGGERIPRCFFHPDREAVALCVSCGRAICAECDRRDGYLHKCPYCHFRPVAACPPYAFYPYPAYPMAYPPHAPYPYPGYPVAFPAPLPTLEPPEPADEREKRWWRADWKLGEIAVALLAIFGLYNVLGVILLVTAENPLFYSYLAYALFFCPLILLSAWIILRRHGRGREELGLRWGKPGRTTLYGMLGSGAAMAFSYGAYFAIYLIFYLLTGRGPVAGETEQLREMGGAHIAMVILVVALLAPFFEEVFFRGLFYPALRRSLGPRLAIFINGLVFGALHFQPLFILSLVLVGIVLAYLYEKTDSLLAPIAAHSLYNLSVTLIALLAGW